MINPKSNTEAWHPGKNDLYKELQQSTTKSRLNKAQIMTMLTQTQNKRTIHPRNCKEMLMPRIKLHQQWGKRNHANLEKMNIRKQETKEKQYNPHAKKRAQTELIQYIAAHPEMPEEMELKQDDRKQLAELARE